MSYEDTMKAFLHRNHINIVKPIENSN